MFETMEVAQGQHVFFPSGKALRMFTVKSGSVEVYVCTSKNAKTYHRIFLMTCSPGEVFFSPIDIGEPFELSVYALSDSVISAEEVSVSYDQEIIFRQVASEWFHKLASVSWIKHLAGRSGDMFSRWEKKAVFDIGEAAENEKESEEKKEDKVVLLLLEQQEIFSALVAEKFGILEESYRIKLQKQVEYKKKSMLVAINNLLKTGHSWDGEGLDAIDDVVNDQAEFAVRCAARRLGMSMKRAKISLAPAIAVRLDPVTRMKRMARKANMQVRLVTLPVDWYKSDIGIILGYYGDEYEPVALLPENKHYMLVSESHPFGIKVDHEIADEIQKSAFMCYPCLPERSLGLKDLFRFMLQNLSGSDLRRILIISFISGILALFMPLITESIFNDIIPINDRRALGTVVQVMLISGLTTAILETVRSIACLRIKVRLGMFTESAMWFRLMSLPLRFFRQYQVGDIINRMNSINAIRSLLEDHVLSIIFNMIFFVMSLGLMMYYSIPLTVFAFLVWFVYFLLVFPLYRRMGKIQQNKIVADNQMTAHTLQLLNGLTKFKLQGGEETAFRMWAHFFGESWKWGLKMRWTINYSNLFYAIQPIILTMVIFYATTHAFEKGLPFLSAAAFMGFQAAISNFNSTLNSFISIIPTIYGIVPQVKNIKPILETAPEVTEDKLDAGALSGEIDVRNLFFSYAPDSPMVLKGLTFKIRAGESVAFVGPSGCGKSTLLRILLGLEKPTQGAIFYDGQDFSELDVSSVRSQMGVVIQNGQLMGGRIFTNIIGALPLTIDDAWEAARMVGLDKDIKEMPMGMHTYISEGATNISGGQKQRILLARSLVNKPRIVVLDEATSALDNNTQAIVTESINKLGATRIIVAHRLSTIREVDRIFVIDNGVIVEEGNYEQLIEKSGLFASLVSRQIE